MMRLVVSFTLGFTLMLTVLISQAIISKAWSDGLMTSGNIPTFTESSAEWKRGWCDAVQAVIRNRDHYRALVHFPAETVEQSMKRIYESWPPRPPVGFEEKTIVDKGLTLEMAGIDLYVILPPKSCEGTTP